VQVVTAPRVLLDGQLVQDGWVAHAEGRIQAVGVGAPPRPPTVSLPTGVLSPGLVDLQLNGAFGHDLATAGCDGWSEVLARMPEVGVTGVVPTFVTAPFDLLLRSLREAPVGVGDDRSARCLGLHLEGPYLSPRRAGAHRVDLLREPSASEVDAFLAAGGDRLRYVTLAPELPGALDAIGRFVAAGVQVAVGHSDATDARVVAAADAGASLVTHLYNAQRPFTHRDPGVVGAALTEPRFTVGVIADLEHVAATALRVAFAAAGDRIVLVSDATLALGVDPGRYEFAGGAVDVTSTGASPRRDDGTLAGSSLALDQAVRNVIDCGVDPATALVAASTRPADAIGASQVGRLSAGAHADLVWFGDSWDLRATWIGGQLAAGEHEAIARPAGDLPGLELDT
jgi:N-acetylglucosamine-6-phosphate deacetylase